MKLMLETDEDYSIMQQLFATELHRQHDRSTTELQNKEGKAQFTITAKDITALRAAINTITSIISIYQKTQEVVNDRQRTTNN